MGKSGSGLVSVRNARGQKAVVPAAQARAAGLKGTKLTKNQAERTLEAGGMTPRGRARARTR